MRLLTLAALLLASCAVPSADARLPKTQFKTCSDGSQKRYTQRCPAPTPTPSPDPTPPPRRPPPPRRTSRSFRPMAYKGNSTSRTVSTRTPGSRLARDQSPTPMRWARSASRAWPASSRKTTRSSIRALRGSPPSPVFRQRRHQRQFDLSIRSARPAAPLAPARPDTSPQRSAYWMPAMLDGAGNAVKPDWINTYYKRLPASDPQCAHTTDPAVTGQCIEMPNGLRFILGYNMKTGMGRSDRHELGRLLGDGLRLRDP
jgi:hypothetical protein